MSQGFEASYAMILESFSSNFSLDKARKNGELKEIVALVKELEKVKFLLPSYEFLEVLKGKIYCSYCLENIADIQTKCDHHFCNDCFGKIINESQISKSRPSCSLCTSEIVLSDPYPGFIECKQCGLFLHESFYYEFPLCHPTCKICICKGLSVSDDECTSCYKRLRLNYDSFLKCSLCSKELNIIASYFLCRSHSYCFTCFKAGLSEGRCFSCDTEINPSLHSQLMPLLSSKCLICNNTKEKSLFINKTCCVKKVCVRCQVHATLERNFGEKCLSCQKKLNLLEALKA